MRTIICAAFIIFWGLSSVFSQPYYEWSKSTQAQSPSNGAPTCIHVDVFGNSIVSGNHYYTKDFDPDTSVFNVTSMGSRDIFVWVLDKFGNFKWAVNFGEFSDDVNWSVTSDNDGNVYATGVFQLSQDFDPGPGIYNMTPSGTTDIFVCKLDSSGNFVWAKKFGGPTSGEQLRGITFTADNSFIITGFFNGTADFDPSPSVYNLISNGAADAFICKYDTSGALIWAFNFGNVSTGDFGEALVSDLDGNIYVTGSFGGTVDFDFSAGTSTLTASGLYDVYILKLDSNGSFIWVKSIGGNAGEYASSIDVDENKNVYFSGWFEESTIDLDPSAATYLMTSTGRDGYICKFDNMGQFIWANQIIGPGDEYLNSLSISDSNLYSVGQYNDTLVINSISGVDSAFDATNISICGFLYKTDLSGSMQWIKQLNNDSASASMEYVDSDNLGAVYITGHCISTIDFNFDSGVHTDTSLYGDYYVLKLSPCGIVPPLIITSCDSICEGDSCIIKATGCDSYLWNNGLGEGAEHIVWPNSNTIYSVTGSYSGGCSTEETVIIVVKQKPTINASGSSSICEGDTLFLAGSGADYFGWQGPSGFTSVEQNPIILNAATINSGSYMVTGSLTNGCSDTASIIITVNSYPSLEINSPDSACSGKQITLNATGAQLYQWSTGSINSVISIYPTSSQFYYVTGTNGICSATDSVYIQVNPSPIASAYPDTTIQIGESCTLHGSGGFYYLWDPAQYLDDPNSQNPECTPLDSITYMLIVTNEFGCEDTAFVTVLIENDDNTDCGEVFVPNAFSPNRDGRNDIFGVFNDCLIELELKVFNQWGNVVFETSNPSETWDGSFKNEDAENGVYSFFFNGLLSNGSPVNGQGNIVLMR